MKPAFLESGWKSLQLVLAVLLPLHTGLAQATMQMPAQAAAVTVALAASQAPAGDEPMAEGMPCHHEVTSSPVSDHHPAHKGGCCDAGTCHCVAACGLSFLVTRVKPQRGAVVPLFAYLSVPAAARPPDLRPPIR